MTPRWEYLPNWAQDETDDRIEALTAELGIDRALSKVLVQRGISTFAGAKAYFAPEWSELHDPFQMLGMREAVARILLAKAAEQKVLIYGDYDVDGTTAVASVYTYLKHLGMAVDYYLPDRYSEGYGISAKGIEFAAEQGFALVVALDCGVKDLARAAQARELGISLIICDHHTPGPVLPDAILLNPKQPGCPYPFKELSGCGIGLKLVQALVQELQDDFDTQSLADFATLAIACDIVPILGENRIIAFHGLKRLRENPSPGLRALMALSERPRQWAVSDLVFFLGPRINAAGRVGHARDAVALLLGDEDSSEGSAEGLHGSNETRRTLEENIWHEAVTQVEAIADLADRRSLVLHSEGWSKGVIGIVASKIVERYRRPTVLLTRSNGLWVGSSRSIGGFDLYSALENCAPHLVQFGGHKYAAGLALEADKLPGFIAQFELACATGLTPEDCRPVIPISAEVNLSALTHKFVRVLGRMEPFGPGNMRPVFVSRGLRLLSYKLLKARHLKLKFEQYGVILEAIGFDLGHRLPLLEDRNARFTIAHVPSFNTFREKQTVELELRDILVE